MTHSRWACWAAFCAAWCFGLTGYFVGAGAWPWALFSAFFGVFGLRWAAMCWRDHLNELGLLKSKESADWKLYILEKKLVLYRDGICQWMMQFVADISPSPERFYDAMGWPVSPTIVDLRNHSQGDREALQFPGACLGCNGFGNFRSPGKTTKCLRCNGSGRETEELAARP